MANMANMARTAAITLTAIAAVLIAAGGVFASPEHARKTGQACAVCHSAPGEAALTETGLGYAASGYAWPPKGGYRVIGPIRKPVRYLVGYLHMTASFIWFGAILYVHILLRPAYASKGLPRGELIMGAGSMAVVGITGVLLTVSRIGGLEVLVDTTWGMVLLLKMLCYLLMVGSAAFVILVLGPRLKAGGGVACAPEGGVFDPMALGAFDGGEGRAAFIARGGIVYDVTGLRLWRGGLHMKHRAGQDLTDALSRAPHGAEKLDGLRVVGRLDIKACPPKSPAQRAFYAIAYMNLALVFVVLFVISYWRWGI